MENIGTEKKEYHAYATPRNFGCLPDYDTVWMITNSCEGDIRHGYHYGKFGNWDDAVQFLIEQVGYKSVANAGFMNTDCHYRIVSRIGYFGARSDKACGVFHTVKQAAERFDGHDNVSIREFDVLQEAAEFAFGRPVESLEARRLKLNILYGLKTK